MITVVTHYTVHEPIKTEVDRVIDSLEQSLYLSESEARELAEFSNMLCEGPNTSTLPNPDKDNAMVGAFWGVLIVGALLSAAYFVWGA